MFDESGFRKSRSGSATYVAQPKLAMATPPRAKTRRNLAELSIARLAPYSSKLHVNREYPNAEIRAHYGAQAVFDEAASALKSAPEPEERHRKPDRQAEQHLSDV
jgi:hypothetical protein